MAREYTKIHNRMWCTRQFREMSASAKLCYMYLLTSPHGDKAKQWSVTIAYAADDLGWPSKKLYEVLGELFKAGLAYWVADEKLVRRIYVMDWLGSKRIGIFKFNLRGRSLPKWFRQQIFERDGYQCAYCGVQDNLEIDHIHPVCRGGTNAPKNLTVACKSCNTSKGPKTLDEWSPAHG